MDAIDFSKDIPPTQLAEIFRNYFEQHMAAYYILQGMQYGGLTVNIDNASLIYSVRLISDEDKNTLNSIIRKIKSTPKKFPRKAGTPSKEPILPKRKK